MSMYHQIHCLNSLRETINGQAHHHRRLDADENGDEDGDEDTLAKRASTETKRYHVSHCLNYLRETILCAADVTLEPEIAPGADNVGQALGVTHVCRDWSKVHAFVERNEREWEAWKKSRAGGDVARNATDGESLHEHHRRLEDDVLGAAARCA